MPYRVTWADEAAYHFSDLSRPQYMAVRKMVGSFPHDRWLKGRPFRSAEFSAVPLLLLNAGERSIVYSIDDDARVVRIVAIV